MAIGANRLYTGDPMEEPPMRERQTIFPDPPVLHPPATGVPVRPVHASLGYTAHVDGSRRTHHHDGFHLVLPASGEGTFVIDDRCSPAVPGHAYLVSPGQPHSFSVAVGSRLAYDEITFVVLGESPPINWDVLLGLTEAGHPTVTRPPGGHTDSPGTRSRPSAPIPLLLTDTDTAFVSQCICRFAESICRRRQGAAEAYLDVVLDCVAAAVYSTPEPQPRDPIAEAREHIERTFAERYSLEDLAAVVGVSAKHLCRRFSARYGVAPFAMKRKLAIRRAQTLIVHTDYPIKEIAAMVGFADLFHFSRTFKRMVGRPPTTFRSDSSLG